MGGPLFHPRHSLGLALLDQGTVYGLGVFPYKEEGKKAMDGFAYLFSLGNLEGEEPNRF